MNNEINYGHIGSKSTPKDIEAKHLRGIYFRLNGEKLIYDSKERSITSFKKENGELIHMNKGNLKQLTYHKTI